MASIFSKIVNGEIPCHKVAEDDHCLAFLDINPLRAGHTLVIPKKEVDYIFDMDDKLLCHMMVFSKQVASAMKKVIDCNRIGVTVIGLEVPHAHIHLIPIDGIADMDFGKPKLNPDRTQLAAMAERIRSAL